MMKEVILDSTLRHEDTEKSIRAITAVFTLLLIVGLFVLHLFKFPVDSTILQTQIHVTNMESTRAQGLFYISLLGLFALICAAVLLWPNIKISPSLGRADWVLALVVVIAAISLGSWAKLSLKGFTLTAILLLCARAGWFRMLANIWPHWGRVRPQLLARIFFWLLVASTCIYVSLFLIAPIYTPLLIQGASEMRWIEGHYAVTVLPGFDMVCCSEIGTIERANYGLGMPLLTSLALKVLATFGIPETALVQAVKLNQLFAVVMIRLLSCLTNRKFFPYVMVLALGMTAYTLSNVGISVGFPNQSGVRYIPILASLTVLVLEMRRAQVRIWMLASAAAIFVIMSPETGLATTAGYIVAVVLNKYSPKNAIASILKSIMWFGVIFVATAMIGSILLIGPILKGSSGGLFQFLALFSTGGYGGLVDKPSMTAAIIFFVATTAVLRAAWRARSGVLLSVDAYEAAVGTMMLVWLMYYVNRMHEWNLWFQLVLLVLLISPRITLEGWKQVLHKSLRGELTFFLIVACLVGGQLVSSSVTFAYQVIGWQKQIHAGCADDKILDGKCLPWLHGSKFETQMDALINGYSPAETLVLTGVSTFSRLHGFNEGFPWYDPMEAVHKKDVDVIVNWIEKNGPKYIVADDPGYEIALATPEHSQQIQSYLPLLISYREVRRDGGWIVLERVANSRLELH